MLGTEPAEGGSSPASSAQRAWGWRGGGRRYILSDWWDYADVAPKTGVKQL